MTVESDCDDLFLYGAHPRASRSKEAGKQCEGEKRSGVRRTSDVTGATNRQALGKSRRARCGGFRFGMRMQRFAVHGTPRPLASIRSGRYPG